MSRIISGSRIFFLGVAFVMVMAGTGALLGAIAGVILMLLAHAVMGLSTEIAVLMPPSVAVGTAAAASLGLFLIARHMVVYTWQPRLVVSVPRPEQKQIPYDQTA